MTAPGTLSLDGSPTGVALSNGVVTFTGLSATVANVFLGSPQDDDPDDEAVTVSIPTSSTGTAPILTATNIPSEVTGSRTGDGRITITDDDITFVLRVEAVSSPVTEEDGAKAVFLVSRDSRDPGVGRLLFTAQASEENAAAGLRDLGGRREHRAHRIQHTGRQAEHPDPDSAEERRRCGGGRGGDGEGAAQHHLLQQRGRERHGGGERPRLCQIRAIASGSPSSDQRNTRSGASINGAAISITSLSRSAFSTLRAARFDDM